MFKIDPASGEIPVGQHTVEIVDAKAKHFDDKSKLVVTFEAEDGSQLDDWLTLSARALWRWEQLWNAAGLDWPVNGGEIDECDLVGRRVHIEVVDDEYGGVVRRKVREVGAVIGSDIPNDGFERTPVPDDEEDAF